MSDPDDERVQQVIDELDPTPAHEADWPVSRRATLRALASVGALAAVPSASAQSAGTVIADDAVLSNYGSTATANGYNLTIDGATFGFDGSSEIGLPDGTSGTDVVTPSGASAREVIGPDGSTVWGTPAVFELSITGTNEPITEGDTLAVDYSASNTGVLDGVKDIALEIDSVEEDRDSDVSIAGGQTATGALNWTTQDGETGSFTARVFSPDDSASVTVQVESAIPDSGISRWTFDDADTESGTAVDVWGNNDGTINGASTGVSGANKTYTTNEAYSFDGSDDNVTLNPIPQYSEFTVAMWVNADSITDGDYLIYLGENYGPLYIGTKIGRWVGRVTLDGVEESTSTILQQEGTWEHLVFTVDTDSQLGFYRDGGEVAYTTSVSGTHDTANEADRIGESGAGGGNIAADIDDVRFYSKALSSEEVSSLYSTGGI